ncbi:hypothetical protein BH24ACI5_BH24ACI5_26430 [soil metagenome]
MPVRKFRSVEVMNDTVWRTPGDPALYRTMAALWQLARQRGPRRFPPGVHKGRLLEEDEGPSSIKGSPS